MKTVITPVGTSLFKNYLEKKTDIWHHYEAIKDKLANQYDNFKDRIKSIKPSILDFIEKNSSSASAEIQSISKIKEEFEDSIEVRLLASDSVVSVVVAEILANNELLPEIKINFNRNHDIINGLQVKDADKFANEGMKNLINRIYSIANGYFGNIVLNITGGFKATIPFLTIFGQVNNIPLYYIYEETDVLIKIPQIPLNVDWKIFEDNKDLFSQIERKGIKETPYFDNPQIEAILEKADGLICFNSLGVILWEKYKSRYELFYLFKEAKKEYDRMNNFDQEVIKKSLQELSKRLNSNPTDRDLRHGLENCIMPEGFYCFKHKEDNKQVRILWHTSERKTSYGTSINDIYIASFWVGREVHNAEAEYVEEINNFTKKHPDLKSRLDEFVCLSVEK